MIRRMLVGVVSTALLGGCTGALLEPLPVQSSTLDDRLQLTGHLCTQPPNTNDFPVKVLFIVDESGSMCISDPPGSQQGNGFCEMPQVVASWPANAQKPGRVKAIDQLLNQFIDEGNAGNGNVSVAILPFETSPMQPWPQTSGLSCTTGCFAPPDQTAIQFTDALASELGNGTDTQGVLEEAYTVIAADMANVSQSSPQDLPRTRYEVVFLTDGTPFPHCTASTNLPPQDYATPEQPWLTWENDSTYCTQGPPQQAPNGSPVDPTQCGSQVVCINGKPYQAGTDINQNYQIFDAVKSIMSLKSSFNVGDVRIDTVLLLNEQAVQICGSQCTDVYGIWPGVNQADYPQETFKAAQWLLQQIATIGNGTYQAFTNGQIENLSLAGLDYASLASPIVMKNLFVQALTSVPTPSGRIFDSDGDGLPDTADNTFTLGTDAFDPDTLHDCIGDGYRVLHKDDGFTTTCADARGECAVSGSCAGTAGNGCICSDGDGDGLPDDAEDLLGGEKAQLCKQLADCNGDGIPDEVEARYGFDITAWHDWQHQDTDGDGVSDWDELRANTDPTVPDADLFASDGYQYQIQGTPQADGSTCYDFTVSNLKLLQTPAHTGSVDGFNLFKVWFDESPASSIATDYGHWSAACAWAQYSPPSVRVPAGPSLSLNQANGQTLFVDVSKFGPPFGNPATQCAGTPPQ
ncbi:MAG: cell-cell cohesion protein MtsD [Myxococcales bacterium]